MNLQQSDLEKYFSVLELLFDTLPYVFWKDREGRYQGANQNQATNLGFASPAEFMGKTIFEILKDPNSAQAIEAIDQKVMQEDKSLLLEERMMTSEGEKFYYSQKTPIHDKDGHVIGLLGFSMDITEFKKQKIVITEDRDRLVKIAAQVAHDINSPLAALKMMIDVCDELPENKRSLLRRIAENILDIANNLLNSYSKDKRPVSDVEHSQDLLVSDFLTHLLSEKKMQYRNRQIRFETVIDKDAQFAFITVQKTELHRSMSNLINNAVDALENRINGMIAIKLVADSVSMTVSINDNGKGMSDDMVKKLQDHQYFTEGKKSGHGLGLQQVCDMLSYNKGIMTIQSTPGQGTSIQLTFPRITAADWIAQEIHLQPNSIVLILDDEESIHGAWNIHFTPLLQLNPGLTLHHFTHGLEALNFLETLNLEEKDRVLLLSDYELLHQDKSGLEVIRESKIKQAILVTSHYGNSKIRASATQSGIKVLPKQMASVVPIYID